LSAIGEMMTLAGDQDQLEKVIDESLEAFPHLSEMIFSAREEHMTHAIRQWLDGSDHKKILVVCGLGHKNRLIARLAE